MASLDVTEAFTDDIMDIFFLVRRSVSVGVNGINTVTEKFLSFRAVVVANQSKETIVSSSGQVVNSGIDVYTQFELISLKESNLCDLIIFNGKRYFVDNVNDYSNWGRGFYHATCPIFESR